jgi:polyisoprenoid-binding protein YceI
VLGVQDIPDPMREMVGGAKQVASFEAGLTIDRRDFGVGTGSWAQTMVVAGEVDIQIALEAAAR